MEGGRLPLIGEALKSLRRNAGLTQEALAERSGVSVRGLRKLESGVVTGPRRATLEALADALELKGDGRADFLSRARRVEERSVAAPTGLVPRQLPPRLTSFVGRAEEVGLLDDVVARVATDPYSGTGTVVVTMSGLPGVGKTALAVEWGHRAASRFPDGQLYLNLRGFDAKNEPLSSGEALRELLTSLGVAESKICSGLEARIGQYRTLVSAMRILVILDNAVDPDQVRPLLPAGAGSASLVLSRHRLVGLVAQVGAVPVSLGVLRPAEASQLILLRLSSSARAFDVQMEELQPLVDMCSGLPLALALVASRAQLDPEAISEYATLVGLAGSSLPVLVSSDRSSSFEELLLGSLGVLSLDAQRCFLLIGLGVSSEISLAELASLCGCGRDEARRLAGELLDSSLGQLARGERLALHDLIWEFVTERARSGISADDASQCRKRLLDYLLQGSVAATAQFAPYRERPDLSPPADGIVIEKFGTESEARAWMSSMIGAGVAAVGHATAWGFPREAAWLAEAISAYLDIHGRWDDLLNVATFALRAGDVLGDSQIQALAYRRLAIAQARTGDATQSERSIRRALSLYSRAGDKAGEAYVRRLLGNILEESGDWQAALEHRRRALVLFEELGDEAAQVRALNGVGWTHAHLGDLTIALDYCTRSAELAASLMHVRSAAAAWDSIGFIQHAMRDFEASEEAYQRALAAWRDIDERYYQAMTLERLGRLRVDMVERRGAIEAMKSAMELFDELGVPQADSVRARLADLECIPLARSEQH